jgi:hypothetical protein
MKAQTIRLVILVHVDKRVKIDVTVEVHARPEQGPVRRWVNDARKGKHALDTPIIPEIL